MKNLDKVARLSSYLKQHWFKLACFSILLYLFIQKDFRFSVNLNSPTESIETSPSHLSAPATQKKEIFTERKKDSNKILDKFEMPSFFTKSNKINLMTQLNRVDEKAKHDYLKRFAKVVINERRKFGIPSSILLACGLLQSQAGKRDMAMNGNNHFALNCSLGWEGESGSYQGACFRHYENAWTSFRDHSVYLTSSKFGQLTTLESNDYKSWARGLEKLNYGGIDDLETHLINLIEQYGLNELDRR
jgi:flagellum-specific peptidoglycan hydrolase FlgJ